MTTSCYADLSVPENVATFIPRTATKTTGVLHIINGEHYAGAERVQDLLAINLGSHGYRVGLACLKPGQFEEMRQARDARLYDVPMRNRLDISPAWELARIVRRDGYRLIHSHTTRSALIASLASAMTGIPMVHHVHSPAGQDTTHRWRNRVNALGERVALGRAKALIAVSESLGRRVRDTGFDAKRVFVVPNGVPSRQAVPTRDEAKTTWTLGTIALFRPRKGLEVLIQSVALLRAQGRSVRLRAVGCFETAEYEHQIKALAERLGVGQAIDWVGFARNVDQELAQMDLFVLPSLFGEGLPMVVLEAMSAGLPVVASRVEGIPEAVRDGLEGLVVDPGNPRDLARSVDLFVANKLNWRAISRRAVQRHSDRFSDFRMAAGVAEVYDRVLADGR